MLSICIGHRNRTAHLQACVQSLNVAVKDIGMPVELVVSDYCECGCVCTWLPNNVDMPVTTVSLSGPFNTGKARNSAAEKSRGDILYFCDVDMVTPQEVIAAGLLAVRSGKALFPRYRRYKSKEHTDWFWGTGHGNCICSTEHWMQAGRYIEKETYGGEDTAFANWFDTRGLLVRKKFDGYYHLWHPSLAKR